MLNLGLGYVVSIGLIDLAGSHFDFGDDADLGCLVLSSSSLRH